MVLPNHNLLNSERRLTHNYFFNLLYRIFLSETFILFDKAERISADKLEVFIENVDSANGETKLSREKAIKQKAWNYLFECFTNNKIVSLNNPELSGFIKGRK